jgi:hypothetical protein
VPAYQLWGTEFKPQYYQKEKKFIIQIGYYLSFWAQAIFFPQPPK